MASNQPTFGGAPSAPKQRRLIILSSSSEEEERVDSDSSSFDNTAHNDVAATPAKSTGFLRSLPLSSYNDGLLDSSSSSLEDYLQSLTITDEARKNQEEGMVAFVQREIERSRAVSPPAFGADDSESSLSESSFAPRKPRAKSSALQNSDTGRLLVPSDERDSAGSDGDFSDDTSGVSTGSTDSELDVIPPWQLDSRSQEVFLPSSGDVCWPGIRIPKQLYNRLYDYQKTGVKWMAGLHQDGIGGVCGDDMGMGKTFMTLSYLGGLMRAGTIRNALIIAPLSVLRSWEKEAFNVLKACVRDARVQVLSSDLSPYRRSQIIQEALECPFSVAPFDQPHLVISTYGLVQSASSSFLSRRGHWQYVVLDEGHQIKNQKAKTNLCCHKICENAETRRLMLTGTPILNNLTELWSLFDFATSGRVLGELKQFKRYYARPIEAARDKNASDAIMQHGNRVNQELQGLLKPYFLQRLKVDFLQDKLPRKRELVVWTHLSAEQRRRYADFIDKDSIVRSILSGQKRSPLEAITWLKKLCGHPQLASDTDGNGRADRLATGDTDWVVEQSAKLGVLTDLVAKLRDDGHRTLVFSQSTKMLDIIQSVLYFVSLSRIDGSTKEKDRQRFVDEFNDGHRDVMLLSTKAAGIGLTLTGADRVIVYDPSWTPAEDSQAVDRAYRIGQTKEVLVFRLITAGTVEEKMYEKQIHKDGIRRTVFTEGFSVQRYFDRHELRELFKLAPAGVCLMKDKLGGQACQLLTDWSPKSFVLSHSGVVGVTPHDGVYSNPPASTKDSAATPFGGQTGRTKGRARRVLESESSKIVPLGQNLGVSNLEDDAIVDLTSSGDTGTGAKDPQTAFDNLASDLGSALPSFGDRDQLRRPRSTGKLSQRTSVQELCSTGEKEGQSEALTTSAERPLRNSHGGKSEDVKQESKIVSENSGPNCGSPGRVQRDENVARASFRETPIETILEQAISLRESSRPRRALQLLEDALETRYSGLDRKEKLMLHYQIAQAAADLNLLDQN